MTRHRSSSSPASSVTRLLRVPPLTLTLTLFILLLLSSLLIGVHTHPLSYTSAGSFDGAPECTRCRCRGGEDTSDSDGSGGVGSDLDSDVGSSVIRIQEVVGVGITSSIGGAGLQVSDVSQESQGSVVGTPPPESPSPSPSIAIEIPPSHFFEDILESGSGSGSGLESTTHLWSRTFLSSQIIMENLIALVWDWIRNLGFGLAQKTLESDSGSGSRVLAVPVPVEDSDSDSEDLEFGLDLFWRAVIVSEDVFG